MRSTSTIAHTWLKKKSTLYTLVLIVCCSLSAVAQNADFLTGRLIDQTSGEPVVFATLRLKGYALGVISDKDGGFRIPIEYRDKGTELEISCLGYQTVTFPFSGFNANGVALIRLRPVTFELTESVVSAKRKKLNAEQIVRYALNNIPTNFPTSPYGLVGYYRDFQLQDEQYINLNEALIEVLDQGFQSLDPTLTNFLLYKYKKNTSFPVDSFAAKPYDYIEWDKVALSAEVPSYGGNELLLLRVHDAVRNHNINTYSFVNRIRQDFIPAHFLNLKGIAAYDGRRVFEIAISRETVKHRATGRMFIDEETFAIRRMDYQVEEYTLASSRRSGAMNEVQGTDDSNPNPNVKRNSRLLYKINVEYKEQADRPKGKLYLNYISFENVFRLLRPAPFRVENIVLDLNKREIEVWLNKPPANLEDINRGAFQVEFLGRKVPIEAATFDDKDNKVVLRVTRSKLRKRHIELLFSPDFDVSKSKLSVTSRRLRDENDNKLGDREQEQLRQFREFFTQKVVPYRRGARKSEKMDKDSPLFDPDQPIFQLEGSSEFWMNTPLPAARKQ